MLDQFEIFNDIHHSFPERVRNIQYLNFIIYFYFRVFHSNKKEFSQDWNIKACAADVSLT